MSETCTSNTSLYRISIKLSPYITVDVPSQDQQLVKDLFVLKDSFESKTKPPYKFLIILQKRLKIGMYKNRTGNGHKAHKK